MNNTFCVLVLILSILGILYVLTNTNTESYYPDLTTKCRSSYFPYYQYSRNYDRDILGRKKLNIPCEYLQ